MDLSSRARWIISIIFRIESSGWATESKWRIDLRCLLSGPWRFGSRKLLPSSGAVDWWRCSTGRHGSHEPSAAIPASVVDEPISVASYKTLAFSGHRDSLIESAPFGAYP